MTNTWLPLAAILSAIAGVLHLAIIAGGPAWYRFFGAGEGMAGAAERGSIQPTLITLAIAFVLFVWAAYALSGAGIIRALPFAKPVLAIITAIYLARSLLFVPAIMVMGQAVTPFAIWSSLICLVYGLVHLVGTIELWREP